MLGVGMSATDATPLLLVPDMPRSPVNIGLRAVERQFRSEMQAVGARRDFRVVAANVSELCDTVVARWWLGHSPVLAVMDAPSSCCRKKQVHP